MSHSADTARTAQRWTVRGLVQGVGFRPFVYRLANQCQLTGRVHNDLAGVRIEVEGTAEQLARFRARLEAEAPPAAHITEILHEDIALLGLSSFTIGASSVGERPLVRVPRDLVLCSDCRRDIEETGNRRQGYPFTNCTACGPRYSILLGLPYDRPLTAMRQFIQCRDCSREYSSPDDRRFHAQPNACPACGPQVALWDRQGRVIAEQALAIEQMVAALGQGEIVAVKGLGGFQLLACADDPGAVRKLRQRKNRPSKPLAVMVADLTRAEELAHLETVHRRLLSSAENPIVLCEARPGILAEEVAPRTTSVGLFLPTTPLHHLLLSRLGRPIVATSGNASEEPIVIDESRACSQLGHLADLFLVHDRPIVRRVDDSVVQLVEGRPMTLRLARGLAPLPLPALEELARGSRGSSLLAVGAHQKAALALWTGTQAILAQHIGDMDHPAARESLQESVRDLCGLYQCEPAGLACDLHPDYFTTRWAESQNQPLWRVQHHHAHAAAVMVEHHLLDREVLALCWDGTGYGSDGSIWGGEILRATLREARRVSALLPFPLPGGEAAVRNPARTAFGLLHVLLGDELLRRTDLLGRLELTVSQARGLASMVRQKALCPWTTSAGRLFDGISALVLGATTVTYEGEAAVWLEAVADPQETGRYPLPLEGTSAHADWRPLLAALLQDLRGGADVGRLSARFHGAFADWAAVVAEREALPDVVLGGGCFQNRLLTGRVAEVLRSRGRRVHIPGAIPANDGGLAAGQLAIALALNAGPSPGT